MRGDRGMTAVLKHELKSYFHSMTAYVFGAGLLLAVGLGAMLYNIEAAVSNFEFALSYFSIIFAVIVPILTMRVIAEERKQKTDQLLYSLPITTTQVIVGKYLALLADYTAGGGKLFVAAGPVEDGEETEISAYIRAGESQIIYEVSSGSYKKLAAASYNDLRHPEVIWADFDHVQQIDISLEGDNYTLASEQDGDERTWSYQDGDELEIADLRSSLENLTAEEFTNERPSQKEEIGLTIHLDNENFPQVQIKLYRYDGSSCLAVVDGESVSLVARSGVVDLIEAVHAIVLE